jgi:hypothetical protein
MNWQEIKQIHNRQNSQFSEQEIKAKIRERVLMSRVKRSEQIGNL